MKRDVCFSKGSFAFALLFILALPTAAQWSNVGGNVSFNNTYPGNYSFTIDKKDTLYTAFADNGNQYVVTVKKKINGIWVNVGIPGFITGSGLFYNPGIAVAINPIDNMPYIALSDGDHDNKISVLRFNGSAWVYVGAPGVSSPSACGVKLAFTSTGIPYVSFSSCYDGSGISVMRFTGVWQYAGLQNFATGNYMQLVISPDNTVAVAFQDQDYSNKMSVMRFVANTWIYTGPPGFSDGAATHTSITADENNALYVSYADEAHSGKITVRKLVGNAWMVLGSPSFSNFNAFYTDINVNKYGIPYVSYVDNVLPVAKKFRDGAWQPVGNYIITTSCSYTAILNDSLGNPYVLLALQPFLTLPFVYTYKPCNDTDYHFIASAVVDSAISSGSDSTTITVTATGGQPPYTGTGTFKVAAGYYTYTITDGSGCTTSVSINVAGPCTQNYWTGSVSTAWEDAANWSCGEVPGINTIVYVTAGSTLYPAIHSIVTCKQLHVSPGGSVTVATGANLVINGP